LRSLGPIRQHELTEGSPPTPATSWASSTTG